MRKKNVGSLIAWFDNFLSDDDDDDDGGDINWPLFWGGETWDTTSQLTAELVIFVQTASACFWIQPLFIPKTGWVNAAEYIVGSATFWIFFDLSTSLPCHVCSYTLVHLQSFATKDGSMMIESMPGIFGFPRVGVGVVKVTMIASLEHTLQTVFGDGFGSRHYSLVGFWRGEFWCPQPKQREQEQDKHVMHSQAKPNSLPKTLHLQQNTWNLAFERLSQDH